MSGGFDLRSVSALSALKAVDSMLVALRALRDQAREEWMAADPTALSSETLALRKGRQVSADAAYDVALRARNGILGDTTGGEEETTP